VTTTAETVDDLATSQFVAADEVGWIEIADNEDPQAATSSYPETRAS